MGFDRGAYPLTCPVCGRSLEIEAMALRCVEGHSFDVAREGYANLLVAQHRSRNIAGDVPEMLRARRRFLEAGHYEPLRRFLAEKTASALARRASEGEGSRGAVVAEVGCGEGYYVGGIAEQDLLAEAVYVGADLSKDAVRMAARRYPGVSFMVADTHRALYLASSSVSVLLDVFAPRNPEEFARVVEPGGLLLVVIPTDMHLADVREAVGLLGIERDKEGRIAEQMGEGFVLVACETLQFPMSLTAGEVADLVDMGPSYWHKTETRDPLERVETTASFVVMSFERNGAARG